MRNQEEIEQAFLGCIIYDNNIIGKTLLKEDDFLFPKNKILFKMFKGLYENKFEITPLTFKSFLEKKNLVKKIGYDYFVELDLQCENSFFYRTYENLLLENIKNHKIEKIKKNITSENILESTKELNLLHKGNDKGNDVVKLVDSVYDMLEQYKNRGGMLGYKGPFSCLDKYIGGVIHGKVYTIMAYSNVGKSSFSYPFIVNAIKEGKKVKIFSLEEQKDRIFLNIIKSYYNKNIKDFSDDFYIEMEKFENLTVYDDISKLDDITKLINKDDFVCIDFIQNIKAEGVGEYEKMTNVAQELQLQAINKNAIILNISQVNNESRNKNPAYMQPKGSGAIFASTDIIFALYYDNNELKMNIIKNKVGPNDINFIVNADFPKLQFKLSEDYNQKTVQTDFNI